MPADRKTIVFTFDGTITDDPHFDDATSIFAEPRPNAFLLLETLVRRFNIVIISSRFFDLSTRNEAASAILKWFTRHNFTPALTVKRFHIDDTPENPDLDFYSDQNIWISEVIPPFAALVTPHNFSLVESLLLDDAEPVPVVRSVPQGQQGDPFHGPPGSKPPRR
jgi:hypothetical protein